MSLLRYIFLFGPLFFLLAETRAQLTIKDVTYDSTVVTFKAGEYQVSKFKRYLFGAQNRKLWNATVSAPVFNIKKSGLQVVKQGGRQQTITFHLVDPKTGYRYVLRSIDKSGEKALSDQFHNTFIADIFQDQTSADNPYGAFTIAPMATAIGIYHTDPFLVYVPHDTAFGDFVNELANKPALFEMKADSNMSAIDNFGNPSDVRNTGKMFSKVYKTHDNRIDEEFYARSRLFDMLIGDWGRHDDQWRWGETSKDDKKLYRSIPRDRDHAYFRMNGVFPNMAKRAWAFRSFSDFVGCYYDIKGLNISAASLDRKILTSMSEEDWVKQATYIQEHLPDSLIERAIALLPENAYKESGAMIIEILKARRNQLVLAAKQYYKILAKEVNVPGSDDRELFEVERLNSDSTKVSVHALADDGTKKELMFKRAFKTEETREINLYGLGGDDIFNLMGKAHKGIQVRVAGGEGKDIISDESDISRGRKKVLVYDTKSSTELHKGSDTRNLLSNNPKDSVNLFFNNYQYNYIGPTIYPGYNPDDGFFLGLGVVRKTFEFRKIPYKSIQQFGINYAAQTSAFNFRYLGDFRLMFKRWHLLIDARLYGPQFVFNYFGYGNESQNTENIDFYRTRGRKVILNPSIYKDVSKNVKIGFGPDYNFYRLDSTMGRFITTPQAGVNPAVFKVNQFLGLKSYLKINNVDSFYFPGNGYRFNAYVAPYTQLGGSKKYVNTGGSLSLFKTFSGLKFVTFAQRVGGEANVGSYFFFQAPNIGGTENLRGWRRSRFFGDQCAYSNSEMRIKVFNFRNYIFHANFGFIGFFDVGRVWSNQKSDIWHTGYGPGIWIEFFEKALFTTTFGFSEDGTNTFFKYGFLF